MAVREQPPSASHFFCYTLGEMESDKGQMELARLLVARLERLSADSFWAHRASGLRGALLKRIAAPQGEADTRLEALIRQGFKILEQASREMRPPRLPYSR